MQVDKDTFINMILLINHVRCTIEFLKIDAHKKANLISPLFLVEDLLRKKPTENNLVLVKETIAKIENKIGELS
jgi:hypothetical protein